MEHLPYIYQHGRMTLVVLAFMLGISGYFAVRAYKSVRLKAVRLVKPFVRDR